MSCLLLFFKKTLFSFAKNKKLVVLVGFLLITLLSMGAMFFSEPAIAGSGGTVSTDEIDVQTQGLRPNSCCRLKHNIRSGSDYFNEGQYIGVPVAYDNLKELACPENSGYRETTDWAGVCTLDGIMTFSEWLFWLTTILSVLAIVLGAFTITTAMGDTNKVKKGQKIIEFGVLGMVIAAASRMLPSVIRYFIGV